MSHCRALIWLAVVAAATPVAAAVIDFSDPAYVDATLPGQVDPQHGAWTTTTGTGFINIENTAIDGRVVIRPNAAGNDRNAQLDLLNPIAPGPDNKIIASFDFLESTEGADAGFIWKLMFRDSEGNDLARIDGQKNLIRGRGPGGTGVITSSMTVGGAEAAMRTVLIDIDTTGPGGIASFYQDAIDAANLLGSLAYSTLNDGVAQIYLETFTRDDLADNRARIDNISITALPQPAPGDVNGDGTVDFADYEVIRDNFITGNRRDQGDLDLNGSVDLHDFRIWRQAFAAGGAASVPEPSALALMLAAVGAAWVASRRSAFARCCALRAESVGE